MVTISAPRANAVCTFYTAPPNSTTRFTRSASLGHVRKPPSRPLLRPLRDLYLTIVTSASRLRPSRSLRSILNKTTYVHILLLPALLLLVMELFPAPSSPVSLTTSAAHIVATPAAAVIATATAIGHEKSNQPFPVFPQASQVLPGNSITACCMNRHQTLRTVLPAWQRVANVSEIVLIDWASDPPLHPVVQEIAPNDARIRVIRVDNEPKWVLTRAYNLAMAVTTRESVIRTDCDYEISANFLAVHDLQDKSFFAGNYKLARNENERHLNGAVYIRRSHFFDVGGYDERIQTYGWDDEDLYNRLQKAGLQKRDLSYEYLQHVEHSDSDRAQRDVKFVQVEIDLNSLLLEKLRPWSKAINDGDRWTVIQSEPKFSVVRAERKTPSLKNLVSEEKFEKAWDLALGQRLANDYYIPWDIMVTMSVPSKRLLLSRLNERMKKRSSEQPARALFVHCMHGLGNRLRALGSAMSFAQETGRELVVIWETDAHISAKFSDLFSNEMVMLSEFKPKWPFKDAHKYDKSWLSFDLFNYMEMEGNGAVKGQAIVDDGRKHIYIKSAYVMNADGKLTNWDKDNAMLRKLKPVQEVEDLLVKKRVLGLGNMIGVHIRDRTLERDIKNVNFDSEYGEAASREMEYWRRKSSYKNFLKEMQRLVQVEKDAKFYVATDTVEVIRKLEQALPGKILTTVRDCDGRDARCVRFALADMLCLAETKLLIGSNWSSFTEAASRIGGRPPRLAGQDFAKDEKKVA